jgi:DNA-binding LytR/AlgR family response regulator
MQRRQLRSVPSSLPTQHAATGVVSPSGSKGAAFQDTLARVERIIATVVSRAGPTPATKSTGSTGRDDGRESLEKLLELIIPDRSGGEPPHSEQLAVKADGGVRFLPIDDIDWLEAEGDYVRFHVGADQYVQRDTLTRLEARLPRWKFLRIHRSALVNVARIREMQPWSRGDYVVVLVDGTHLTSGRSYRARVREFIEGTF